MSRFFKRVVVFSTLLLLYFVTYSFIGRNYAKPATLQNDTARSNFSQIRCFNKSLDYRIAPRGKYWVLYNYVPARRTFACDESVTYTTHAEFTFLDNLQPLLERWRAPVSVAVYAPGTDFAVALDSIRYLRQCVSPLIAEYASFHLYFDYNHLPKTVPRPQDALNFTVNCTTPAPWYNFNTTYQSLTALRYPINVGRNVARDGAQTHYILASDIELYPSPGLVSDFLSMVRTQKHKGLRVFPLCPFEIESYAQIPSTKGELVRMLENSTAIQFHKKLCFDCHHVPKLEEWTRAPPQPGVRVFHVARRRGHWEPFYIGTNADPYYDENLSWEGMRNKMTQCYALCVMDYEFHILDGAFLVHRPGIKRSMSRKTASAKGAMSETNSVISKHIRPALNLFYGNRRGCYM